ncbi:SPOR domain-containing protein [Trinickia caryophylli]|nr:SPOR domain-containing protein [Trinickia caryophylli]PMS11157.1 SPOR domain-containing protein [Trinickia caryophylli]TRX15402.1 SPOR domain-containing protein [Trinickia caryophylli]WQE15739.1 SPOR domain-containing protein [Trinickia caryophylli]
MGLFSFGKKDDAPRRRGGNARSERVERRTRRTERTAGDADAMLLDPTLPEKQRARRRLVGAIALVVAAVVILPMVLDSHPKPVTDDIAIDIPNRPATVPSRASDDRPAETPAVPPERGAGDDAPDAAQGVSPAPALAGSAANGDTRDTHGKSDKSDKSGRAAQSSARQKADAPSAQASSSPISKPPAAAPSRSQSAKPAAANASASDPGSPSAPSGARFAVQLGAFADESNARRWETKLKAAGVPAYIEHRKQADGSTRALLRAGPFPDRAAASAAIAKVREAGLTANAGQ